MLGEGKGEELLPPIRGVYTPSVYSQPCPSLVPHPHTPPSEKRSGEQSRISWAYYPNVVMTNEIARSAIIT